MFNPSIAEQAQHHAEQSYPTESCGLIVEGQYIACDNIATNPHLAFRIKNTVLEKYKGQVQAVLHSHPNGPYWPSAADMHGQITWGVPWGIVYVPCPMQGEPPRARAPFYWGDELPIAPLIGRPFQHGISDCYSYIRDYFRLHKNIHLAEFPRDWDWWFTGQDLYWQNFQQQGFKVINAAEVQEGDCFLAQFGRSPVINHAGVYEGKGLIGHQVGDHRSGFSASLVSRRSPLNLWQKYIRYWVRYQP